MKKLSSALLLLLIVASCTNKPKDYVTLSGKLENNTDSIINVLGRTGLVKTITIKNDGSFKDTLKVAKADVYMFQTSNYKRAPIYLKNGFDISITGNADEFMASFEFTGNGSSNSRFIKAQIEKGQQIVNPAVLFNLEESVFNEKIAFIKKEFDSILTSYNDLDSTLVVLAEQQNQQMVDNFQQNYAKNKQMGKGRPSPKFENYIDIKGGKKSLDSFKGKYVYIDVWATWCGPCIREIPSLQKLEKEYHNKNIEFVSISTDESRRSGGSWETAEKKWRNFVKDRNMKGVQLWAGQDISFQEQYEIRGIPRFILIDPQGNIVDANAPRPSDPRLKQLFTSLGI